MRPLTASRLSESCKWLVALSDTPAAVKRLGDVCPFVKRMIWFYASLCPVHQAKVYDSLRRPLYATCHSWTSLESPAAIRPLSRR